MMQLNDHLRQSGRTTRMIERALELERHGRAVYILVHAREYAERVRRQLHEMDQGATRIKVEPISEHRDFDWATMRLNKNAHPNCAVVVDHVLAEQEVLRLQAKIAHFELLKMQVYQLTL